MIKIRPFKKSDAATVASWITSEKEFYEWSAGKLGEYPPTARTLTDLYDSIAENSRDFQMVAYDDEGVFAHILLRYPSEDNSVLRFCFIIEDPARRGQGLGKKVIKQFISYAHSFLGVSKVTLSVYEHNMSAYRAYLAAGFYETKEKTKAHFLGEEWTGLEMENYDADVSGQTAKSEAPEKKIIGKIITGNSFAYAFQPIIYASSGEIYGYEALMRAEHEGHSISPLDILKYAEKNGKMYDIEKATMFNVMSRYEICKEDFKGRKIFINSLPGYQLTEADFKQFSQMYGKYFNNLIIEVTEHSELKEDELGVLLSRSERNGFELAVDDYGTGFSNTASLLRYLPNCVKIDRLLISNLQEDTKKQHFVRGIVEFAHANGFMALAEGVETFAELSTAIGIGIDLIQGFYVARPSFDILEEIPDDIRSEILSTNAKGQTSETRKIYVVSEDEEELPVMRVALEQNTGMLISGSRHTLVGNTKYCAEMSIKIKDGTKCRLTIRDVFLESIMQLPCLELGQNVDLTLVLEGENRMRKLGIFVPESSSIKIEGDGNLGLRVQGVRSYGIGNLWDGVAGKIEWNGTGALDVLVEADEGIGIGGGIAGSNSYIKLSEGTVRVEPACGKSVAIGAVKGQMPIVVKNCNLQLDLKTDSGIGIGCGDEVQGTWINDSKINIICAGTKISAIGNYSKATGNVEIANSEISILANGQSLYLIGAEEGDLHIRFTDSNLQLKGEGNEVMAIGTRDMEASIVANHTDSVIKLASGSPLTFGAQADKVIYRGGTRTISVNE